MSNSGNCCKALQGHLPLLRSAEMKSAEMKYQIFTGEIPFLRDAQEPDLLGYGRFRDTEDVPPCVHVSARVHHTTYLYLNTQHQNAKSSSSLVSSSNLAE